MLKLSCVSDLNCKHLNVDVSHIHSSKLRGKSADVSRVDAPAVTPISAYTDKSMDMSSSALSTKYVSQFSLHTALSLTVFEL